MDQIVPNPPTPDPLPEPMNSIQARNLGRWILKFGNVVFTDHVYLRMDSASPPLTEVDVINVIRAGAYKPPEIQNGSWRYRIETQKMFVAIAFNSSRELVVCTARRFQ